MSTFTPRQHWLINRVRELICALEPFKDQMTWEQYMIKSKELAEELLYACTEWEKYYDDMETK